MKYLFTLLLAITNLTLVAELKYPHIKIVNVIDTYFGVTYPDVWLEDMKDTTVVAWFKNQADLTNEIKGTNYPAVMCVAGWNAPYVIAWEPGKFAATLQNASTSTKPVLMKVNYEDSHFTEDKSVNYANFAISMLLYCGNVGVRIFRWKNELMSINIQPKNFKMIFY